MSLGRNQEFFPLGLICCVGVPVEGTDASVVSVQITKHKLQSIVDTHMLAYANHISVVGQVV